MKEELSQFDVLSSRLRSERNAARAEAAQSAAIRDEALERARLAEEELMALQSSARMASHTVTTMLGALASLQSRLSTMVMDNIEDPGPQHRAPQQQQQGRAAGSGSQQQQQEQQVRKANR